MPSSFIHRQPRAEYLIRGIRVPVGPHLSQVIQAHLAAGLYERQELGVIGQTIDRDDIVMELGTGCGVISAYCAKTIGSRRVHTYEANPELEEPIRRLYAVNSVDPQLHICMVGHELGTRPLYIEDDFWTSSPVRRSAGARVVQVPTRPFNEEVRRINPTYLIVDIEGGEYDLLMRADLQNIRKVLVEMHGGVIGPERVVALAARLRESGFQLSRRYSYTLRRRAYLAVADLIGADKAQTILGIFRQRVRSDLQENQFFLRALT